MAVTVTALLRLQSGARVTGVRAGDVTELTLAVKATEAARGLEQQRRKSRFGRE